MALSIMRSTRFVEPFAKEVDQWELALSYIMETLEAGMAVQREWLYLEVFKIINKEEYLNNFILFRT